MDVLLESRTYGAMINAPLTETLIAQGDARAPTFCSDEVERVEGGGVEIDSRTQAVISATGQPSPHLYALGPITRSQYPIYLGLEELRHAAQRITRALFGSAQTKHPLLTRGS